MVHGAVRLALINADTTILQLTAGINYLQWLRQYFRAAARRSNRIGINELAHGGLQTACAIAQLPQTLSANAVAQQELIRRQARVFRASTTKSGYFLAMLYRLWGALVFLAGALAACAFLDQHYQAPLQPLLGGQLLNVVRAMPALGYWLWLLLILLAAVTVYRVWRAKNRCLQHDVVPRPEARPLI